MKASKKNTKKYKFGIQVPRNVREALEPDKENGNYAWGEAMNIKKNQLFDYETFEIKKKGSKAPPGYQYIKYQFVFDVKYDLRRKARLVARGDMTNIYEENYCGVVNMETLFLSIFVAIHNDLP